MTTCGAHSSYKCGTSPTKVVCDTIPYMTTPTGRTTPYLLYLNCFHPPLHIIKLKPNICQVCACVRQDLGHRTRAKTRQTQKTRDRLEEKRAKHNTHTQKTITLQPYVRLDLIYPSQPSKFLTLHPVQHCYGAKVAETKNPASKRDSDWWRGGEHTFSEARKDP